MKNLNLKKGISLIVLVITIIVMIILAAAVIISLSNNGIIGKANEAVDVTDEKQMQILAQTLWADAYMDNKRDTDLVTAVKNGLKEVDPNYESKYNVDITNEGVELNKIQDDGNKEVWKQVAGEITLINMGTNALGVTTYALTPGYNIASKYKLHIESPVYTGSVELTPFYGGTGIAFYSGFYMDEDKNITQVDSLSAAMPYIQDIQTGNIKGEVWINNPTENAIIVYTSMAKTGDTYKVTKIEELVDKSENEYGFCYNTIYAAYDVDSVGTDVKICIRPEGTIIQWQESNTGINTNLGYWEITDAENLKVTYVVGMSGEYEIVSANEIKTDTVTLVRETDGKIPVAKDENGIYKDGLYFAKNLITDTDNDIMIVAISIDSAIWYQRINIAGGVEHESVSLDSSDIQILNDGKTLIIDNIIYELPEEIYDVQ